jgi:hypothetical protein
MKTCAGPVERFKFICAMLTYSRLGRVGRLGNQLFQVAFLTSFAERHGIEYSIPPWRYARHFAGEFAVRNDLGCWRHDMVVKEPGLGYHENYFVDLLPKIRVGQVDIIGGYFQSFKYFSKSHVMKIFSPKDGTATLTAPSNSVAISVRRKNFVRHPNYNNIKAELFIKLLNNYFEGFKVFVFSDNYNYCRKYFIGEQFEFLEGATAIEQLFMMSQFENFILSNSTFSYWGPMLNPNPKLVLFPKWMFTDAKLCDLYNQIYWPNDPAYVGYDNPINKPRQVLIK